MMSRLDRICPWTAAGLALFLQPWGLVRPPVPPPWWKQTCPRRLVRGVAGLLPAGQLQPAGHEEVYADLAPDSSRVRLGRLRTWVEGHQDEAIVTVCLLLGLWLVGKSIYQLTA